MMLVRYEKDGNDVWALWENEDGNRWYEHIVVKGADRM